MQFISSKIGGIKVEPRILLAPLAGFTDSAYRRIVKSFSAGIVYTEMVSSMGIFYKDEKTLSLLRFYEEERPIGIQIFGSNPDKLAHAAAFAEEKGFDLVDINMGCPTAKIIKSGAGAALLKDLKLTQKIIRAVRKAIKIPLTIKIRKGFSKGEDVTLEMGKIAENEGVNAICLHGITVEEYFKKESEDWESIRRLKESVHIPVIGNGGIQSEEDVLRMFQETGADYVMAGRATLGAPHFIKSANNYVKTNIKLTLSLKDKLYIILRHIELEIRDKGEERGIKEMRKIVAHYIKGMKGASHYRAQLNTISTKYEMENLLKEIFHQHKEV